MVDTICGLAGTVVTLSGRRGADSTVGEEPCYNRSTPGAPEMNVVLYVVQILLVE